LPRKSRIVMAESTSHIASEPAPAYGMNSYTDVMSMLHSMPMGQKVKEQVARRLVLEVESKYLSKAFSRLNHLAELERDWDGHGALPISHRVLNNVKSVLAISGDDDWKEWMIGPDTNATLGLQSKTTMACISVGAKEYSYYAEIDGKEYYGNHLAFTPESFLETMRSIV